MPENMAERLRRLRDDAVYALENANYQGAYDKLLAAQVIFDTTPNSEKDGLRTDYRSIEGLMKRLEAKIRGADLKRIQVEVTRPDQDDLCWN